MCVYVFIKGCSERTNNPIKNNQSLRIIFQESHLNKYIDENDLSWRLTDCFWLIHMPLETVLQTTSAVPRRFHCTEC
jgi:hypothetical protein